MAITIDVLTSLDERSLAAAARTLSSRLSEVGNTAGGATSAMKGIDEAQKAAALSADRLEIAQMKLVRTTMLHKDNAIAMAQAQRNVTLAQQETERSVASLSAAHDRYFSSIGRGAAVALGAITGLAAGTFAALAGIGEQFEGINRAIVTSTGAAGPALEALNAQARQVMAGVDTSVKSIGSDLGVLSNRLQLVGGDPALTTLTKHVEELRDRFGGLDIRTLTGDFVQFGVAGRDADATLASIMNTSMATAVPLNQLLTTTQQFGETLQQAGLNIEQSVRLIGKMDEILGPGGATRSMTGFAHAEEDAAKRGETLQQFLMGASGAIQSFINVGDQADAQALMEKVFGTRNWPQAQAILNSYMDILKAGGNAWRAQGSDIDDVAKRTKTLGNYWDEIRNKISSALAPPGQSAVDVVGKQMELLVGWVDAHKDDLRNFFQNAINVIGIVVKELGDVAAFLGRHPALIYAVAGAFAAWKTIEGITALITGLRTVTTLLTAMPAEAATAGAGIAAGLAPAVAAFTALATAAALWNSKGSAPGATMGTTPGAPNAPRDEITAKHQASQKYADAHGGQVPPGYQQWLEGKGPMPSGMAPYYNAPGSSPTTPVAPNAPAGAPPPWAPGPGMPTYNWVPGQGYVAGGTPGVPATAGVPTPGGGNGDAQAFLDSLGPGGKGATGSRGSRLPEAPEVPYGPGYRAPLQLGESEQHYAVRGNVMEAEHKVAEDQARLNQLEKTNTATAEEIQKARNKLDEDIRREQEARARLQEEESRSTETHQSKMRESAEGFEQLGAKIDQDFGASKGLPGIAENLFKFLANLAAAPITGAANAYSQTQGGPTFGAKGLVGAAALGGAFGPQLSAQGLMQQQAEGQTAGSGSETIPSISYPGSVTNAADLHAAGGRVGALYAFARSLVGTPYSQALRNDCSGMVSKLANVALGLPPSVDFATPTEGAWLQSHGFQPGSPPPGVQAFQVGWNPAPGNAGHTAATLPGGINAEQGGNNNAFTLGPGAAGANSPQFPMHAYLPMQMPGFAAGGDIKGQGPIPILAHEGEHVLTKSDVDALGGHDGVYAMRASLHQSPTMQYLSDASSDKSGPQSPIPKSGAPEIMPPGLLSQMPKVVQGGHEPGPSMIGTIAPQTGYGGGFAITGGGLIGVAESIPSTAASMAIAAAAAAAEGGAVDQLMGGMPGGASPAMPPSLPPAGGAPGGSAPGGGGSAGGSPAGSITSALIGIGIQEMNAAIGAGGKAIGAGVGGLLQTFGPGQFAQSKLAQSGWVDKIVGGITGAQPQLPNMAGQTHQGGSLTPEQAASASQSAQQVGQGGAPGPGGPSSPSSPLVHIENYHVSSTEDRAGQDLARHFPMNSPSPLTGSR
jgi:hypothetical protein